MKQLRRHEKFGPPPRVDVLGELILQDDRGSGIQESRFGEKFNLNRIADRTKIQSMYLRK